MNLGNLWAECSRDPGTRVEVVERYLAAVLGEEGETPVQVRDVVALVKNEDYVRLLVDDVEEITDHLVGDLWVVYGIDRPRSIESISVTRMAELGLEKVVMRRVAMANLRRMLPSLERHGEGDWFLLTTAPEMAAYVSSLMLLDVVWETVAGDVDGEIVVGVPTRDVLLVTGSRSREGLVALAGTGGSDLGHGRPPGVAEPVSTVRRTLVGARMRGRAVGRCVAAAVSWVVLGVLAGCGAPRSGRVVIGAKNFTEQVVLGEMLAQEIEAVTGERVERRFYLAGSYLCHQALIGGRIDGYVEYTGTALTAILKEPLPGAGRGAEVLPRVRVDYEKRFGVRVEKPLGFEDTFAMVVRGEEARRLGLKTISQAVGPAAGWRLGVGYEFESRPDGLAGLEQAYGLKFAGRPRTMELGLLYRALQGNQVDMVAGNSTDGPIRAMGFTVLEDDRHYFPPYEAVPLVREDALRQHPGIQTAVDRLAGKVTAEEMQRMNDAVDAQHRDVGAVVREWRQGRGL